MDPSIWFKYNKLEIVHCTNLGVSGYKLKNKIAFLCLMIVYTCSNSVDPNEMQHHAAFHLGLHCLPKYPYLGVSWIQRVKLTNSVQSRGGHGPLAPFFIEWPLGKARVGHLLHYVNGEILGCVLFSSEIK